MKYGYVYIMTNKINSVLYVSVTSDLLKRVYQHRNRLDVKRSFCYRYRLTKLVYFESTNDISVAIRREKQIKGGSRAKKINLISAKNPQWNDIFELLV